MSHLSQKVLLVAVDLGQECCQFVCLLAAIVSALGQEQIAVVLDCVGPLILHRLVADLVEQLEHPFNVSDQVH